MTASLGHETALNLTMNSKAHTELTRIQVVISEHRAQSGSKLECYRLLEYGIDFRDSIFYVGSVSLCVSQYSLPLTGARVLASSGRRICMTSTFL